MKVWYEVETKEPHGWLAFPRQHDSFEDADRHRVLYIANPDTRIVRVTETREVVE